MTDRRSNGVMNWVGTAVAVVALIVSVGGFVYGYGTLNALAGSNEKRIEKIEKKNDKTQEQYQELSKGQARISQNLTDLNRRAGEFKDTLDRIEGYFRRNGPPN